MIELIAAATQAVEPASFFQGHFDAIITVFITILGFIITYFMTKKNFKDEVIKNKLAINADIIKDLPYEVCELMDRMSPKGNQTPATIEDYTSLLAKILAYGSKDAVLIAIHMQKNSYKNPGGANKQKNWEILACYALLISQIKYDLTSEIISPESWFNLKISDYSTIRPEIVKAINSLVDELRLNKNFRIKEET